MLRIARIDNLWPRPLRRFTEGAPRASPQHFCREAEPGRWLAATRQGRRHQGQMKIGILGSGLMGGKLGTLLARAGHQVVFSYARSEAKLQRLARAAKGKARAGTPREAAHDADALLLAVHWSRVDDVLIQAGDLAGKVVVSCSAS